MHPHRARVALRIVQQIHEHAAQMFHVEGNLGLLGKQIELDRALGVGRPPVVRDAPHGVVEREDRGARVTHLVLHPGNVEHVFRDVSQPFGVLAHHLRQAPLRRFVQFFRQELVGLCDGRERVADFVRHRGGHASHGRHFFNAQARFHLPQILQEHHAQQLMLVARRAVACCREPGAHAQAHGALSFVQDGDVRRPRLRFGKRLVRQLQQRPPACIGREREGYRCLGGAPDQRLRHGVGQAHLPALIQHQHAVAHVFHHHVADRFLGARGDAALLGVLLLVQQARGQLVGQPGDDE